VHRLDRSTEATDNAGMIAWWEGLLLVGAGGALGGLARFGLSQWIDSRTGGHFPWGTLAVNTSGALLIGVALGLVVDPSGASWLWLLLVVGVLGSYTTVSSFSLQTVGVAERDGPRPAIVYVLLTLGGGLALVYIGHALGRVVGGAA
jgi:CrcB protein